MCWAGCPKSSGALASEHLADCIIEGRFPIVDQADADVPLLTMRERMIRTAAALCPLVIPALMLGI